MSRSKKILIPLCTFLVILVVWQLFVMIFKPPRFILPAPLDILETMIKFGGGSWSRHVSFTLLATLEGFVIAVFFGVLASIGIVSSRVLNAAITPLLVVLQVIPKVAFAPLMMIWFGTNQTTIVLITFLVSFFPVVVNMTLGLNAVEPELIDLTRCYHMSKFRVMFTIRFPNALPFFWGGIKVASTLAVVGAIIGEFVGSSVGLGYLIIVANNNLNTSLAMASILLISVFGLLLYELMVFVEWLSMPWNRSQSGKLQNLN